MLNEIKAVKQKKGEPHKRWFNDADFDLFTWHRRDGSVRFAELRSRNGPGVGVRAVRVSGGGEPDPCDHDDGHVFR